VGFVEGLLADVGELGNGLGASGGAGGEAVLLLELGDGGFDAALGGFSFGLVVAEVCWGG